MCQMIHREVMHIFGMKMGTSTLLRVVHKVLWKNSRWLKCRADLTECIACKIEGTCSLIVDLFKIHGLEQLLMSRITNWWHSGTNIIQVLVFIRFYIWRESSLHSPMLIKYLHLFVVSKCRVLSFGNIRLCLCKILNLKKFLLRPLFNMIIWTQVMLHWWRPHLTRDYLMLQVWIVNHCCRFVIELCLQHVADHLGKIWVLIGRRMPHIFYLVSLKRVSPIVGDTSFRLCRLLVLQTPNLKLLHFIINFE